MKKQTQNHIYQIKKPDSMILFQISSREYNIFAEIIPRFKGVVA